MGIDESWRHNLAPAVNDLCICGGRGDVLGHLDNDIAVDEKSVS